MDQHTPSQRRLYDSEEPPDNQRDALVGGDLPVAVYGLGETGLGLAAVLGEVTGNVVGADTDRAVVGAVDRGRCPIEASTGLRDALARTVGDGSLSVTPETDRAAARARVHVLAVPARWVDDGPDIAPLRRLAADVGTGLRAGDLVVVASTLPPGGCRTVVGPVLADASGLDPDAFGLAYSPNRARGGALADVRGPYPKVVGGRDEESERAAALFLDTVGETDVVTVENCTAAECVPLFEGAYRDVNVALANELARLADELPVDVAGAFDVANTYPGCDLHTPGPEVDRRAAVASLFLTRETGTGLPLVDGARERNAAMPLSLVDILERELRARDVDLREASVAVLGTHRPGDEGTRPSVAARVAAILSDGGAGVYLADPDCADFSGVAGTPVTLDLLPALELDGVVLVTALEPFESVAWGALDDVVVVDGCRLLEEGVSLPVYTVGAGKDRHTDRVAEDKQ
jgi:UDP-N-acetyl-D-mannosaminuronic acid dehydrogenase